VPFYKWLADLLQAHIALEHIGYRAAARSVSLVEH
jgi:hypothetical protein